ncbi:curli production assembly/transport component CsgF [Marinifilum sp. N1E240]|uniref:curli production assembly/transport component CsgF n=1 Tax=Marinifilum sp. N1E240 TaxID=2608082 RepID=UPI00128C3811|nr:curli production assembly/transport component CsgF [Marinifilum sp. N1E240]MPQ46566.1 curli production assembly/transport component CsgF [Marinifilum sp. N1E240]
MICLFALLKPFSVCAQDFVYTPINSNFGGNIYNYNWLINSANQQNKIEDPTAEDGYQTDPLDDFQDNLNRQILNQLSSQLVNQIFGEGGDLETGTYNLGSYQVDIYEDASGVTVNIQDITNGNYTNVVIPSY